MSCWSEDIGSVCTRCLCAFCRLRTGSEPGKIKILFILLITEIGKVLFVYIPPTPNPDILKSVFTFVEQEYFVIGVKVTGFPTEWVQVYTPQHQYLRPWPKTSPTSNSRSPKQLCKLRQVSSSPTGFLLYTFGTYIKIRKRTKIMIIDHLSISNWWVLSFKF